jgi:hypothetical protein
MKKLWPPKVKGIKNSKKQTTKHYQGWLLNTQKIPYMYLVSCSVAIKVPR